MIPRRAYLFLSNLDPQRYALLISELALAVQNHFGQFPLVLDLNLPFQPMDWASGYPHPARKFIRRSLWGRVAYLPVDQLPGVFKGSKSKEHEEALAPMNLFLPLQEPDLRRLPPLPLTLIALLHASSDTVAFLYATLTLLGQRWGSIPPTALVYWGEPRIEVAAERHAALLEELTKLLALKPLPRFLGHLFVQEERLRAVGLPPKAALGEFFPEDAFQGQLKRLWRNMTRLQQLDLDSRQWASVVEFSQPL